MSSDSSSVTRKLTIFMAGAVAGFVIHQFLESGRDKLEKFIYEKEFLNELELYNQAVEDFQIADKLAISDPGRAGILYSSSIETLKNTADAGLIEAMKTYGEIMCYGRDTFFKRNQPVGLHYLAKAAENGLINSSVIATACQASD
ncbi:hypothetical protein [Oceaniradius stylonematis]|uniref:hypothetical protein n=1 Tax=Oceaniradius stylonematis TaxID=2184161 RepID=UPI003C7B1613